MVGRGLGLQVRYYNGALFPFFTPCQVFAYNQNSQAMSLAWGIAVCFFVADVCSGFLLLEFPHVCTL